MGVEGGSDNNWRDNEVPFENIHFRYGDARTHNYLISKSVDLNKLLVLDTVLYLRKFRIVKQNGNIYTRHVKMGLNDQG